MVRAPPHWTLLDDDKGGSTTSQPPLTTASATRDHGGSKLAYTSQANFDTNMVIILGALLCALICALGLNSLIRCALRCTTDPTRPDPARPTRFGVGFRGLKRSTIRQIPIAIYSNKTDGGDDGSGDNNNFISTDCIVCLGEFEQGEKIRVLPKCKHGFHIRCIDPWLLSHSSCPTCRQLVSEWNGYGTDSQGNALSGDTQRQLVNESG